MKYDLKEHPYLLLSLAALFMAVVSFVVAYLYNWSVYALVAVGISGVGFLILFGSFIYDLVLFRKKKKEEKK